MDDEREHSTLRDALAFLRRRWAIILAVPVVAAGLALALSLGEAKVYKATASLRVHDPTQDFPAAGLPPGTSGQLPSQIAAQAAQTANRADVLTEIRRRLKLRASTDDLRGRISSSADPTSGLVQIKASARTSAAARDLANAAADADTSASNGATQGNFAALSKKLREQVDRLGRSLPKKLSALSPAQRDADQEILRQQQVLGEQAARLSALSSVSQPVQVSEYATAPSSPDSPTPARNAIIGAIVGLLIGLIAARLVDSVDRRLRQPEEAAELVGFPVVGALAKDALGAVPIDPATTEHHVAGMDSFRMVRNNIRFLGGGDAPRSILVTSPLSKEGKTTVAIGIALAAAAGGLRTVLVEADLHRPVHAARLGLNAEPGLADYLRGEIGAHDLIQVRSFVDPAVAFARNGSEQPVPESQLACITAGRLGTLSAETLGSQKFVDLLTVIGRDYDLVVIDTPPLLAVAETLELVRAVDGVVYCVRLGQTTAGQAVAGRDALARLPERLTALMVTDLSSGSDRYGYYGYAYDYRYRGPKLSTR